MSYANRSISLRVRMFVAGWTVATLNCVPLTAVGQEAPPAASAPSAPRSTRRAYRLLIQGDESDAGIIVRSIQPGSPVLRMKSTDDSSIRGVMDVGDVIVRINDSEVRTLAEYAAALDAVGPNDRTVRLLVRDVSTGVDRPWQVRAAAVSIPMENSATSGLRKVHFLLVGLTADDNIGKAMEDTLKWWRSRAVDIVDKDRVASVQTVVAQDCNAQSILQTVRDMEVASRDTLFCIYCGHGAYDKSRAAGDPSGGHFFAIPPQDLMRKSLTDGLRARNARLTVMFSDTCNVEGHAFPEVKMLYEQRTVTVMGLSPFEKLLFDYRGFVDISGADKDQYGFCEPGTGAWVSAVAAPVLVNQTDWQTAANRIRLAVDVDFQERKKDHPEIPQEHLTPVAFQLQAVPDPTFSAMAMAPPQARQVIEMVRRPMSAP